MRSIRRTCGGIVCCSGKVFYDLLEARRAAELTDVAIVRLEQLYPFPVHEYAAILDAYPAAKEVVWCQEEPQNQGAWYQIRHRLQESMGSQQELFYAGRGGAAAPAAGIFQLHVQQQQQLVEVGARIAEKIVFDLLTCRKGGNRGMGNDS